MYTSESDDDDDDDDDDDCFPDPSNINFIDSNGDVLILEVDDFLNSNIGANFTDYEEDQAGRRPISLEATRHSSPDVIAVATSSDYAQSEMSDDTSVAPQAPVNSPAAISLRGQPVYVVDLRVPVNSPNGTETSGQSESDDEPMPRRAITVRFSAATEKRLRKQLSFATYEATPIKSSNSSSNSSSSSSSSSSSLAESSTSEHQQSARAADLVQPDVIAQVAQVEAQTTATHVTAAGRDQQYKKKKDLRRRLKLFTQLFTRKNKNVKVKLETLAHV